MYLLNKWEHDAGLWLLQCAGTQLINTIKFPHWLWSEQINHSWNSFKWRTRVGGSSKDHNSNGQYMLTTTSPWLGGNSSRLSSGLTINREVNFCPCKSMGKKKKCKMTTVYLLCHINQSNSPIKTRTRAARTSVNSLPNRHIHLLPLVSGVSGRIRTRLWWYSLLNEAGKIAMPRSAAQCRV